VEAQLVPGAGTPEAAAVRSVAVVVGRWLPGVPEPAEDDRLSRILGDEADADGIAHLGQAVETARGPSHRRHHRGPDRGLTVIVVLELDLDTAEVLGVLVVAHDAAGQPAEEPARTAVGLGGADGGHEAHMDGSCTVSEVL